MDKKKISVILNILIVLLVLLASFMMFNGIRFSSHEMMLESRKLSMFRFFTVDSNIFMGLVALIYVIYSYKKKDIPKFVYILKHMGVAGVTLTFLVTLFVLAPTIPSGFISLYVNSNLFFHLIIPLLSIISYVFYERYDNKYIYSLYGLIPMIIYMNYYVGNLLIHYHDNIDRSVYYSTYDFYNFLHGNIKASFITIPLFIVVTYLISLGLTTLNIKLNKNLK